MFSLPFRLLSTLLCLLLFSVACAAEEALREEICLSHLWDVQPAKTPDSPPNDTDWGRLNTAISTGVAEEVQIPLSSRADWRSAKLEDKGATWVKTNRGKIHDLWYRQSVPVPAGWQGRRIVVDFVRIEGDAVLFLNGKRVAELLRPGGEIDLTPEVRFGADNELLVFVTRMYTGISRGYDQDPLRKIVREQKQASPAQWGLGISGPVTIRSQPMDAALDTARVIPSWRNKSLSIEVETVGETNGLSVTATVRDAGGKTTLVLKPVAVTQGKTMLMEKWTDFIPWELDGAYLYTAEVELKRGDKLVDRLKPFTFGFREIWREGRMLMMNGHPSRWRLAGCGAQMNENSVSFFQLLGYNVMQFQPNPTNWWSVWGETPLMSEDVLDTMDKAGFGATVPVPSCSEISDALLTDPVVRKDYEREMRLWLRRRWNHPSILAWAGGMNYFCPKSTIHAPTLGRSQDYGGVRQEKTIQEMIKFVKTFDETRLVFSHADAAIGDMATANCYLNFVPLQEREEWLSEWAKNGDYPWGAVEMGQPYTKNFWKGKQFLLTEYLAMYFGEDAYAREGLDGQKRAAELSSDKPLGYHLFGALDLSQYPLYWEFQRLFVRNTDRAWRTWGINGGMYYWNFDLAYGDPPAWDRKSVFNRYSFINTPVTVKPSWANENFDIHAATNQALLAYLGGSPAHTDKTHTYAEGETIRKQVVVVWDGPGSRTLHAVWSAVDSQGKRIAGGNADLLVKAGDIRFAPLEFSAPRVTERQTLTVTMSLTENGKAVTTDELTVTVFPAFRPLVAAASGGRIALFDPKGKSAPVLTALGLTPISWKPGDSLEGVRVLVIGREALTGLHQLPYTAEEIANGLRVIILEQLPDVWETLGLTAYEAASRIVFPAASGDLLDELVPEDLRYWRGVPDLLPEGKPYRSHDTQHPPKWTNTHNVASAVFQIPHTVGFTPLFACEFDLDYSPLLSWRYGKGEVYFCSFDFTGRVPSDPVASRLADNLFRRVLVETLTPARRVMTMAGAGELPLFQNADDSDTALSSCLAKPEETLLVVGNTAGPRPTPDQLQAFLEKGGAVLDLPRNEADLRAGGLSSVPASVWRVEPVAHPLFEGIGRNLFRWREQVDTFAIGTQGIPTGASVLGDGMFLYQPVGKGMRLGVQIEPGMIARRNADQADRREAVQYSVIRLRQLLARLCTNLGAGAMEPEAKRVTTMRAGKSYEWLKSWQVLGPFPIPGGSADTRLDTACPGEQDAIAGAIDNPNVLYRDEQGKTYDWRRTVQADENGFINLALNWTDLGENNALYAVRIVESDSERDAILRMGVDYYLHAWVNGQSVYRASEIHGSPKPNRHRVKIHLKPGRNVIALKLLPGSKGFGFWANLSQPDAEAESTEVEMVNPLYEPLPVPTDPYLFSYW